MRKFTSHPTVVSKRTVQLIIWHTEMAKTFVHLLFALILFKYVDTSAQDFQTCEKANVAGKLLDSAHDFISKAKESIAGHCDGLPKYKVIVVGDPKSDLGGFGNLDGYKHFNDLKLKNPKLKTLLAIGGWSAGSEPFSRMASDVGNRTRFVESVAPFLQNYGFDGLDLDWEYPGSNGGNPEDKQNFVILLQELKTNLKAQGLLLTAAVPKRKLAIDRGYDILALSKELDFINLMTYNFHGYGYQENETGMHTPIFEDKEAIKAESTVNFTVDYWLKGGAPKDKLLMGLSLRAKSYTLSKEEQNGIGAPTVGPGHEGPYTRQAGTLGFNEICVNLTRNSWNSVYDSNARAPYAYKGDQWVSYDDMNSFNSKIDYVIEKGLGGVMLWSIDTDDFTGYCYGKKYYLLNTVANRLIPRNN
ncbi:hypothetical protein JTE90_006942 [Oedothorax gibbosus]|uniref:GH18 domain-containing protein n=1 Tax=Oedothorax gibbosus TaxID=931172 RepID=A0AAV6TUB5_9ARAC|nr:hypothetical protein JTE90_006942 [Oedothorax gibbosus]